MDKIDQTVSIFSMTSHLDVKAAAEKKHMPIVNSLKYKDLVMMDLQKPDKDISRLSKAIYQNQANKDENSFYSQFDSLTTRQDFSIKPKVITRHPEYPQKPEFKKEFVDPDYKEKVQTLNMSFKVDENQIENINVKNKQMRGKKANGTLYTLDGLRVNFEDDIMYESEQIAKRKKLDDATALIEMKQKQIRTFDNRIVEEKVQKRFISEKFNFGQFQFSQDNVDASKWQVEEYKKQFIYASNNTVNKKRIFSQMTELIFDRIEQKIENNDQTSKIPKTLLRRNKNLFCKLLLKHPKIQKFYIEFSEKLSLIIESEFLSNSETIGMFLMHPHKKDTKVSARDLQNSVLIVNANPDNKQLEAKNEELQAKITETFTTQTTLGEKQLNFVEQALDIKNQKKYSDFQMELILKAQQLDDLTKSIDENNIELNNSIVECTEQLDILGEERKRLNLPIVPGRKLEKHIAEWANDKVYDDENLNVLKDELWLTRQEFEYQLQDEQKGFEMELEYQMKKFENKSKFMIERFDFQMEAMEKALLESKFICMREVERCMMIISEHESRELSSQVTVEEMQNKLNDITDDMKMQNVAEARVIIANLREVLLKNMVQIKNKDHEIVIQQQEIANVREINKNQTQIIEEQSKIRLFYQHKLLKYLRDSQMFDSDPKKKAQFEQINEFSEMLSEQKEFMNILNDLELQQELVNEVNKNFNSKKILDKMNDQLVSLFTSANKMQDIAMQKLGNKKNVKGDKEMKEMKDNAKMMSKVKHTIMEQYNKAKNGIIDDPIATLDSGKPTRALDNIVEERKQVPGSKIKKKLAIKPSTKGAKLSSNKVKMSGVNLVKKQSSKTSLLNKKSRTIQSISPPSSSILLETDSKKLQDINEDSENDNKSQVSSLSKYNKSEKSSNNIKKRASTNSLGKKFSMKKIIQRPKISAQLSKIIEQVSEQNLAGESIGSLRNSELGDKSSIKSSVSSKNKGDSALDLISINGLDDEKNKDSKQIEFRKNLSGKMRKQFDKILQIYMKKQSQNSSSPMLEIKDQLLDFEKIKDEENDKNHKNHDDNSKSPQPYSQKSQVTISENKTIIIDKQDEAKPTSEAAEDPKSEEMEADIEKESLKSQKQININDVDSHLSNNISVKQVANKVKTLDFSQQADLFTPQQQIIDKVQPVIQSETINQTNVQIIKVPSEQEDEDYNEEDFESDDGSKEGDAFILHLVKDYAVDVVTRQNPTQSKKKYQRFVWDDFDIEKMLQYKLPNVFNSEQDQLKKKGQRLKPTGTRFKDHFKYIMKALSSKVDNKEIIFAQNMISNKSTSTIETQTTIDTTDQEVETCDIPKEQHDEKSQSLSDPGDMMDQEEKEIKIKNEYNLLPQLQRQGTKIRNELLQSEVTQIYSQLETLIKKIRELHDQKYAKITWIDEDKSPQNNIQTQEEKQKNINLEIYQTKKKVFLINYLLKQDYLKFVEAVEKINTTKVKRSTTRLVKIEDPQDNDNDQMTYKIDNTDFNSQSSKAQLQQNTRTMQNTQNSVSFGPLTSINQSKQFQEYLIQKDGINMPQMQSNNTNNQFFQTELSSPVTNAGYKYGNNQARHQRNKTETEDRREQQFMEKLISQQQFQNTIMNYSIEYNTIEENKRQKALMANKFNQTQSHLNKLDTTLVKGWNKQQPNTMLRNNNLSLRAHMHQQSKRTENVAQSLNISKSTLFNTVSYDAKHEIKTFKNSGDMTEQPMLQEHTSDDRINAKQSLNYYSGRISKLEREKNVNIGITNNLNTTQRNLTNWTKIYNKSYAQSPIGQSISMMGRKKIDFATLEKYCDDPDLGLKKRKYKKKRKTENEERDPNTTMHYSLPSLQMLQNIRSEAQLYQSQSPQQIHRNHQFIKSQKDTNYSSIPTIVNMINVNEGNQRLKNKSKQQQDTLEISRNDTEQTPRRKSSSTRQKRKVLEITHSPTNDNQNGVDIQSDSYE